MQHRVIFIKVWLSQHYTKIELCKRFNISHPTEDKWIEGHEQVNFEGEVNLVNRTIVRILCQRFVNGLSRED